MHTLAGELWGMLADLEKGHCETMTGSRALQRLYMLLQGKPYPFRRRSERWRALDEVDVDLWGC